MGGERRADAVDGIVEQWRRERPELDTYGMGPIGRLKRCAALLQPQLEETYRAFGMSAWEFDVLATLRRSGAPYTLSPTALFSSLMITSGTMTHRLQQLEKRGLIRRLANQEDARGKLVRLSEEGLALIDRAVERHVENERRILAAIDREELDELDAGLRNLLSTLEPPTEDVGK